MTEQQQSRVQAGVPTGGQYAQAERSEAGLSLRSLDGSAFYPPIFATAEEIIDFWSNVEIPDAMLARAEWLYTHGAAEIAESWPEYAWQYEEWEWEESRPDPADTAATAAWEGRRTVAKNEYLDKMRQRLAARPARLDRSDVRPLVRACAMFEAAKGMSDWSEYVAVCAHSVRLVGGGKSVRDATFDSGLQAVALRFLDADNYALGGSAQNDAAWLDARIDERLAQQREEIIQGVAKKVEASLDGLSDHFAENLRTTGVAIIDAGLPPGRRSR